MKIIVCVKIIKGEINPFDACALECALKIGGDITVVSMCPPSAKEPLKALTRLGAKVIMLCDNAFAGSDTLATSYILSCAIKKLDYDLILCGRQTIDGDTAQVGPCLSQMLGVNLITNVMEMEIGNEIKCKTRMGDESAYFPALLTVERINTLRFPSIFSKVSEITEWNIKDIGADIERCGLKGSPTQVLKTFESERGKRKCKFIKATELLPLIEELSKKLAEKTGITQSEKKLKKIVSIGNEVKEHANALGEEVIMLDKDLPDILAEKIKEENPDAVLWNADLWGRKNAPVVSAILNTGLCADCVSLETDGENLFMYRPASGGNIIAKIKCKTRPQMATVRTVKDAGEIMLGVGKGVSDIKMAEEFARKIGAEICASRKAVDANLLPYEKQIGLTGRMVCPKIYIAAGISGAVQHTCGIEGAGTIIAINPDKDARIFEYADYGILTTFEDILEANL